MVIYRATRWNLKKVACYRYPILKLIFSLFYRVTLRKHYIIKAIWSVIQKNCIQYSAFSIKKTLFCYKKKALKNEHQTLAIWRSGKHRAYPFLIFVLCSSKIKNCIITGLVSNFLMHLVRGWHFLCRKENIISRRSLVGEV